MLRNHKLISLCIGLLFIIVVQKFADPAPVFRFLLPAFLVYAGVVTYYNRWYLKQTGQYNLWAILRPFFLLCAAFGMFLVIPSDGLRGLFLIFSVLIITACEIILGKQAENLLLNQTLLTAFGVFMTLFAANHYLPTYGPVFLVSVFFASALLTRSFYESIPQSNRVKMVGAIIIGLFCAQIFWVFNFLPFHFSALSLFLFNFFYFCLILNYYHLFHILNLKKIQFHLVLIAATSLAVLLVTPWKIIS